MYVLTGAILAGLLGLVGWWLWTTYGEEAPDRPRPGPDPEDADDSLEDLGIVDIKPQGADRAPSEEHAAQARETEPEPTDPTPETPSTESPTASGAALATKDPSAEDSTDSPTETEASEPESTEHASTESTNDPVLGPLLESARAALDARTVCLLVQEEVALTYRIEAAASTHSSVRHNGTFDTQAPLLTATMSRESVAVRPLAEEEIAIEDLRYYDDPPAVDHLALAPVSQPDTSSTTFLLADAPNASDLGSSRARTLLKHFAETVALFLDTGRSPTERSDATSTDEPQPASDADASTATTANTDGVEIEDPRPRREIIAEEMEAAQAADEELALALVLLNRSESIARRGEEAVASAERLFQARLEQLVPGPRIERFGELTYGIFFHGGADAVEPQVADLETSMAQEEGDLEGGVSVGVAVWNDEDPEALRAEATEALRKAYETGTPTIVT